MNMQLVKLKGLNEEVLESLGYDKLEEDKIKRKFELFFGKSMQEIRHRSKTDEYAEVRFMIAYYLHKVLGWTQKRTAPIIGRERSVIDNCIKVHEQKVAIKRHYRNKYYRFYAYMEADPVKKFVALAVSKRPDLKDTPEYRNIENVFGEVL